jgi:hypothetical protein
MRNRKNLILVLALVGIVAASLTSYVLANSKSQPTKINQQYLQTFFARYVDALNTPVCTQSTSFYSPNAVSVGAWGIEMDNKARQAYFCQCKSAFPSAQLKIKSLTIEPTSETSARITWEFGIKAGKQVQPFLGVMSKNYQSTPDDSMAFDHEGVSIAEVEIVDQAALAGINSLKQQIAAIDSQMARGGLEQQAASLRERRAVLDQQLGDLMVSSIKITRQTSFQNMDAFLKKLKGE